MNSPEWTMRPKRVSRKRSNLNQTWTISRIWNTKLLFTSTVNFYIRVDQYGEEVCQGRMKGMRKMQAEGTTDALGSPACTGNVLGGHTMVCKTWGLLHQILQHANHPHWSFSEIMGPESQWSPALTLWISDWVPR
jgi:hypothetical protein